jgi:hypothetical protein
MAMLVYQRVYIIIYRKQIWRFPPNHPFSMNKPSSYWGLYHDDGNLLDFAG